MSFYLILVISIFKIAVSTRNLKDILIVQSGNIVSTVLGVIHSGRLSGLNLTNFTLGKSIGEFPFNFWVIISVILFIKMD